MHPMDLVARHSGRPLLMTPDGARALAQRALSFDGSALRRPRGWLDDPLAALTRLARQKPAAMEDEEGEGRPIIGPARPHGYAPTWMTADAQHEGFGWTLFDGVACMEITGPLMAQGFEFCGSMFWGYDLIAASLREAAADDRVAGIFIRMESPGGVVAGGLEALTAKMRASREAAGGKPVWVYADMAASAAYWIASAADRIVAPAVGMVGSIGAVIVHEDYSKADAMHGVTVTPIQFGAKKTDGAPWAPLSASAKADLQAEIDEVGLRFVRDVTRGRANLTADALIATEAAMHLAVHPDPARSGVALGLVDAIASEEAAFAQLVAHCAARAAKPKLNTVAPVAPVAAVTKKGATAPSTGPLPPRQRPQLQKDATMNTSTSTRGKIVALTPEEEDVKVNEIAEICENGDLTSADKLTLIKGKLDDAPAETPAEEAAPVAEGDTPEDEKVAPATGKAEGDETPAEDEEEPATPAAKGAAILRLPEAKGREAVAAELAAQAFEGKTSVAAAKRVLALMPKAAPVSKLGAHGAPDHKLGTGASAAAQTADEKQAKFIMDSHALATGGAAKR